MNSRLEKGSVDLSQLNVSNLQLVAKLTESFERYKSSISKKPLSEHTRCAYISRLNNFIYWLERDAKGDYGEFLTSEPCRANAIKAYKSYLKQIQKASPNTVNSVLTSIDHFCEFLGVKQAKIDREVLPHVKPQSLELDAQRLLLEAANCAKPQDKALIYLLLYTGIRIGECEALNVDDVIVSDRKGTAIIRNGKNDKFRTVPINGQARDALRDWLGHRAQKFLDRQPEEALFLNPQGKRMSVVAMRKIVRKIAERARLSISLHPHLLRHSCITNLVRRGHDLVLVTDIAGHSRVETTRRYSLPSEYDREQAMESIQID